MAKSFVFIFLLGVTVYGAEQKSISDGKSKRSDILVYDLVQQMVAEQIERKKILKEFRVMKNELRDVKRDTKREIGNLKNKTSKEFQLIHQDIIDLLNKTGDFGKKVAFSAGLQGHTTTSKTSAAIVFNNVITDIGGGYNKSSGIFHCTVSGLYLISSTLTATQRENVLGYLMKNDKRISQVHENAKRSAYPSAALTVVLPLFTGDKVWIKGYNGITYYRPDCTFTGVLIKS